MTPKLQALCALMEDKGYSYGCIQTSIQILAQSKEAQEHVIDYLYENQLTENQFIAYLASICTATL